MESKMISCKLMGGLGNYMFQIATAYTHAKRMNTTMVVDSRDIMQVHKPHTEYLSNLFRNVDFGIPSTSHVYNEQTFSYSPIPKLDNIKLIGYFQSEKYFDRDLVLKLFDIEDVVTQDIQSITESESVSIHVRRGDYKSNQANHPLCSLSYYESAIDLLGNDKEYYVFSDDIEWCKTVFDKRFNFVSGLYDWEEMYLMSKCKHNIIANSTFSWWGAWLNKNDNKVIAPKTWFGPLKTLNTSDLLPDNWIRL